MLEVLGFESHGYINATLPGGHSERKFALTNTAIATADHEVSVVPAPNDRVVVTLEGRGWTLIDGVILTREEAEALYGALSLFFLQYPRSGSEWAA